MEIIPVLHMRKTEAQKAKNLTNICQLVYILGQDLHPSLVYFKNKPLTAKQSTFQE